VGIETASTRSAAGINLGRKHDIQKLKKTLIDAKDIGLKMYGTFTFGAPGSTVEDDQKTLELMEYLIGNEYLWRFQTSLCTPQPGTPYYAWAKEKGYLLTEDVRMFDGGNFSVVSYPGYPRELIEDMHQKAQKYYDVALCNRFRRGIDEHLQSYVANSAVRIQKILLMRSSRMLQMRDALRALSAAVPGARIDMLVQHTVKRECEQHIVVTNVYAYGDGFITPESVLPPLQEQLRSEQYDLVVIVYGNLHGQGYESVRAVAQSLGAAQVIALSSDGQVVSASESAGDCS